MGFGLFSTAFLFMLKVKINTIASKMKSDFSMATILKDSENKNQKVEKKLTKDLMLRVKLEDINLWSSFHRMTNEMIVTKNGR